MKTTLACVLAFAIGCGGGDGGEGGLTVPSETPIVELSEAEATEVCGFLVDLAGPERTVDCGNGSEVTVGGADVDECVDDFAALPDECPLTVGDQEACGQALAAQTDDEICEGFPPECAPLFDPDCSLI